MGLLEIRKFVLNHAIGVVMTALASLATMVGGYLLIAIKNDVDNLQCRVSQFAARNEYKALQLKLIVTPLDDVKRDSDFFKDLVNIVEGYRNPLDKCAEGRNAFAQIDNYRHGLESFIDRDWDGAIKHFGTISDRTALTEKSMANALLHKYLELKAANDPKAAATGRQWRARLSTAHDLATKESDYSAKERAVAYFVCSGLLVDTPADEGIGCLTNLVSSGLASYAVYYNLSALHARKGSFKDAVEQMEQCLKMPGGLSQRRSEIEGDVDFKQLMSDFEYGPRFRSLLVRLQS